MSVLEHIDPTLVTYAACVAVILVVAAVAMLVLRFGFGKDVSGAWRAYKGWLIMLPLIIGALAVGREATILGIGLVSALGFRELAVATGLSSQRAYTFVAYVGIAALTSCSFLADPATGEPPWYGLFMATPVYVVTALFVMPVLFDRAKGELRNVSLAIVGFVCLGWMLGHLGFLTNGDRGYLYFLLFAVPVTDVAAFTFGKLVGKKKLREHVSPNKTVGGAVGALGVALCLPWLLRFSLPGFQWPELVLTGLLVGIGGQLGDLTISFIKRDIGVKDMGSSIPGHGGILDRADSLIFVAPLFLHMVRWFHPA